MRNKKPLNDNSIKPNNNKTMKSSTNPILVGGDTTTEKKEPSKIDHTSEGTMGYAQALSKYYIANHLGQIGFLLGLIAYIILASILYTKNPYDIITENNDGLSIFLTLFGGFLIVMTFFFYQRKKQSAENEENINGLSYFGKVATSLFSIIVLVALVYLLFNAASYFTNFSNYLMTGVNLLIVVGLITLAFKYFGVTDGEPNDHKPSVMNLIMKIIKYIPCLMLELIDYIKYQYQITTKPIVILLLVEIALIALYFVLPWLMTNIFTHNSSQLLKDPVNLNIETNLGTFRDVNYVNDKFQYHYAISGWLYIDSLPPETNSKYEEYTSLINIGNKPNVLYNVAKNKLQIKMQTEGKNEKIIYETSEFYMQKWNNIVINYDGSTLDIFINNELVSSTSGLVPYNDNTMMTTGTNNGIHGGVCNINYFKENISRGKINWIYNSVKTFNPPVI